MEIKSYLEKYNTAEKIILAGATLAILSLFMEWVNIGFASVNGFQQQGYLLLPGIVYPVWKSFKTEKINKKIAYISVGLAILFMVFFISDKSLDMFGSSVNLASTGMYVMLASLIAILVGAHLNKR